MGRERLSSAFALSLQLSYALLKEVITGDSLIFTLI